MTAIMTNAVLEKNGQLKISASSTSSARDFDFLLGMKYVHHKKLKTRLNNCTEWIEFDGGYSFELVLDGTGNFEQHRMIDAQGKTMEGAALRLFNPATKLWSIYWSDSRLGVLDSPMVGSFENHIGRFYGKDVFDGIPILVQFLWDATNPDIPAWSQAFSKDDGRTWEWNWYMTFSNKRNSIQDFNNNTDTGEKIGVLELRNYLLKNGCRNDFAKYFEANFVASQYAMKGYPIARYFVKDQADNFFWMRGFQSMNSRSVFLPNFYYGDFWKQHRNAANSMIANNDNVYLLHPLVLENDSLVRTDYINSAELEPKGKIAVVEFYISNTKLNQLKNLFSKTYLPLLKRMGSSEISVWESELEENDFPQLPVFQDKNLLVTISFYENEAEYYRIKAIVESAIDENLMADLQDAITLKHSLVLLPVKIINNKLLNPVEKETSSPDKETLSKLNEQFIKNFINQNVTAHEKIIYKDFVCIENNGTVVARDDYMKAWATDYQDSQLSSFSYTDEYIRIFGNFALVRSKTTYTKVKDGQTVSGNSVYTDTYIKENGRWWCVQAQITPVL
ncbi:MAG: DUF4440 domain-containing protein [Bacteroidetes bacterium]|nr:DUF4440 domain-containing protein [Bacteroidota bacterium]